MYHSIAAFMSRESTSVAQFTKIPMARGCKRGGLETVNYFTIPSQFYSRVFKK